MKKLLFLLAFVSGVAWADPVPTQNVAFFQLGFPMPGWTKDNPTQNLIKVSATLAVNWGVVVPSQDQRNFWDAVVTHGTDSIDESNYPQAQAITDYNAIIQDIQNNGRMTSGTGDDARAVAFWKAVRVIFPKVFPPK